MFCSLHPDVLKAIANIDSIFSLASPNDDLALVRASLLNKLPHSDLMKSFVANLSGNSDQIALCIKALYMRLDKNGSRLLSDLLTLTPNPTLAAQLKVIVDDNPLLSAKPNHHRAFAFYRQKVFLQSFPVLLARFKEQGDDQALEAVMCQLGHLPPAVVEAEITPLVPELARALFRSSESEATTLSPAVKSFLDFLRRMNPESLESLGPIIIPFLLKVASNEASNLRDRVAALEAAEAALNKEKVDRELRSLVIERTRPLLDHHKRIVRRSAASVRNIWMMA